LYFRGLKTDLPIYLVAKLIAGFTLTSNILLSPSTCLDVGQK